MATCFFCFVTTGDITAGLISHTTTISQKSGHQQAVLLWLVVTTCRLTQRKRRQARLVRALPAPRIALNDRERQAQLPPTAESVLAMLLPAVCTFWPWLLACS